MSLPGFTGRRRYKAIGLALVVALAVAGVIATVGQSVDIYPKEKAPETGQGPFSCLNSGAGGGNRTHTAVRPADFKSAASTVPPPRQVWTWYRLRLLIRDVC